MVRPKPSFHGKRYVRKTPVIANSKGFMHYVEDLIYPMTLIRMLISCYLFISLEKSLNSSY